MFCIYLLILGKISENTRKKTNWNLLFGFFKKKKGIRQNFKRTAKFVVTCSYFFILYNYKKSVTRSFF